MSQQLHCWVYTQRIESRVLNKYLYTSITHNGQKVETIQVSINRWMDKKNLVYPYNTIAFKRKEILTHGATWMNLENNEKWNKPDTKGEILHDFSYIKHLK